MKIILEIPDYTICAFFNYVEYKPSGLAMGVKSIQSDDLEDGAVIKINAGNEEAVKQSEGK